MLQHCDDQGSARGSLASSVVTTHQTVCAFTPTYLNSLVWMVNAIPSTFVRRRTLWDHLVSDVDRAFFARNDFLECLRRVTSAAPSQTSSDMADIALTLHLTRPQWSCLRRQMGRLRRLSARFLGEERDALARSRAACRNAADPSCGATIDVVMLPPRQVLVVNPRTWFVCRGACVGADPRSRRLLVRLADDDVAFEPPAAPSSNVARVAPMALSSCGDGPPLRCSSSQLWLYSSEAADCASTLLPRSPDFAPPVPRPRKVSPPCLLSAAHFSRRPMGGTLPSAATPQASSLTSPAGSSSGVVGSAVWVSDLLVTSVDTPVLSAPSSTAVPLALALPLPTARGPSTIPAPASMPASAPTSASDSLHSSSTSNKASSPYMNCPTAPLAVSDERPGAASRPPPRTALTADCSPAALDARLRAFSQPITDDARRLVASVRTSFVAESSGGGVTVTEEATEAAAACVGLLMHLYHVANCPLDAEIAESLVRPSLDRVLALLAPPATPCRAREQPCPTSDTTPAVRSPVAPAAASASPPSTTATAALPLGQDAASGPGAAPCGGDRGVAELTHELIGVLTRGPPVLVHMRPRRRGRQPAPHTRPAPQPTSTAPPSAEVSQPAT